MSARTSTASVSTIHTWLFAMIAALFLAVPAVAHAQERVALKGSVLEMGSARALVGAEVAIRDLDMWVFTDASGDFTMKGVPQGRHRVEVHQLGYRPFAAELVVRGEMDAVRFELYPDPVILQGLTAQVDRLRSRRNAIPYATRAVDREKMLGSINVADAIRRSGETLVPCGGGVLDYCLYRRGRAVRPQVYIDERPAFGLDELDAYPVEEFHTIEVINHQMIRAYTQTFMERLALGKTRLFPVLLF